MSFAPGDDAKEQVRQAVDVVELVGSYIQLRRQGRSFVGLCPWHDDSRPSLNVNPERQSWKCWVCDVGGDVFSFVMKAEGLEFREALEMLAERAGIALRPATSPGHAAPATAAAADKRTLLRLMAWAEQQYHRCLLSAPEAEPGRRYLAERGISDESIGRFHLGFAPDRWDWMLERSRGTEWKPPLLERAGLLRRREAGDGYYDWFRGRVMFSIRDARGRPIGFGGRVLPQLADHRAAKYINSPETPLFSKSRELYGLDLARDHFKQAGGVVVMEGYTDVVMAHQHGIQNAVAVLGTALGDRHVQLLRRYQVDSITLVLDGDEAGRRRTNQILDTLLALFEKNEVDLRILTLPEGTDPCDFIATQGSDALGDLLTQAVDALEHKFRTVTHGLDTLTDTHRASQAAEQMLAALAHLRPAAAAPSSKALLREEQMLARVSRHFHLPEQRLRSRLKAIRREAQRRPSRPRTVTADVQRESQRTSGLPAWDRELLELALLDGGYLRRLKDVVDPVDFEADITRQIFATMCRLIDQTGELEFGRLLAEFDEVDTKSLLVELDESSGSKASTDRQCWFQGLVDAQHRRRIQAERRRDLVQGRQDDAYALQALLRARNDRGPEEQRILEEKRK